MLKSKIENLKLHIWYYKKSSKKQLFFKDVILLILASITIIKELNPIYLTFVYFIVYFTSCADMINFPNSALACTPLKVKDTVFGISFIMWTKSTLIILISLVLGTLNAILISTEFNYSWLIDILKYAIVSYPMLKFLCAVSYYISKKYRTLTTYFCIATLDLACFSLNQLPPLSSLISFIIMSILILFVTHNLIKKLSYEIIFFKEAGR